MIASVTQLLDHYASSVHVSVQAHPKGAQLTISIMPCPNKVKDEQLRQQLIAPIVIAGSNEALDSQLRDLASALGVAKANEAVNASVEAFMKNLSSVKAKEAPKTVAKGEKKDKAKESAETPAPTASSEASTPEPVAQTNSALDDLFI